jgi:hypothetical protein
VRPPNKGTLIPRVGSRPYTVTTLIVRDVGDSRARRRQELLHRAPKLDVLVPPAQPQECGRERGYLVRHDDWHVAGEPEWRHTVVLVSWV